MQEMESRTGALRHRLHQGRYGGQAVKPTCLSGTLVGLEAPGKFCSGSSALQPAHGKLADGTFRTAPLARYPDELCFLIASWIVDTLAGFAATGSGPTGWRRSIGALDASQPGARRPASAAAQGLRFLTNTLSAARTSSSTLANRPATSTLTTASFWETPKTAVAPML